MDAPAALPEPQRALLDGLVDEFLQAAPRGARVWAVASPVPERSAGFADDLVAVLAARRIPASTAEPGSASVDELRADVVAPFRAEGGDAVLLVTGDAGILDERRRALWHFSVWLLAGDEPPHTAASALIDVTDPAHPARRFGDYCAVPPGALA